jgi:lysophospholipase L1-like esterase
LLYVLFLVVVVECSFQAFYRITTGASLLSRTAVPIYVTDPYSGWAPRPNLSVHHGTPEFSIDVFTNSRGFRTSKEHEEYAAGRDPSRYRILLLGPSFAFGWGVNHEQTFAGQLPAMLADKGFGEGRKLELINRGVPALPPANNLSWFESVGKTYEPDLVIQFLYGSMDVNPAGSMQVKDGYLVSGDPTLSQRVKARAKSSAIVFYGWMLLTNLRSALSRGPDDGSIAGAGRDMKLAGAFDPANARVISSMAFYDGLRTAVEGNGARLLLVYFPLSYVVHPQDLERWRHMGVQDVERQVAFDRAFGQYLGERGFTCLNLTEALVDEARTSKHRMYYWLDIHWTADGNRVVARTVADWLAARPEWAKRL